MTLEALMRAANTGSRREAVDVAQTTWLRLVESLGRIPDPERLGAWLASTARREYLRHIWLHARGLVTAGSVQR